MVVTVIRDEAMLQSQLSGSGNKLVVMDFTAHWCGPCQRIAPVFERLSNEFSSRAVFLKVDVDECQQIAATYNVSAMPTFVFVKNGSQITRIQGADQNALENKIRELIGSADESSQAIEGVAGHIDLNSFINKSESECLNESDSHSLSDCLTNSTSSYLESDCDEQLIISLAFNQPLKLHSLKISAPKENGPKNIKLFINQPRTLDFEQADGMEAIQKLELSAEDITAGKPIPLKFVKFQNVQNLLIFVKDNQENTEVTRINHLSLIGSPSSATNMSEFKRIAGKKGESH